MEAVILAGGFGTRLKPLTYTRAKPLLPVLNKPMISYLIEQLPKEVDKIILAVNYRKEQIEEFFEEHDFGKEIVVNEEPKPLGTGGATKFAEKHITGRFFVLNSDIISSLDMEEMLKFHKRNNGVVTISLWPVKNVSEFGVVEIKNGRITKFVEKPKPEEAPSNLINAGAYLLEPEVLDYIEEGKLVSMEKEIFPRIIEDGKTFLGFEIKGYWVDVGRISSYLKVHKLLMERQGKENVFGEGCKVRGEVKGTCTGNNVFMEEGCVIKNSVLFNGVKVGKNVVIEESVIGEGCKIGSNSKLINVVVGDGEIIKEGSFIKNERIWTKPVPKGYPKKQVGNVVRWSNEGKH